MQLIRLTFLVVVIMGTAAAMTLTINSFDKLMKSEHPESKMPMGISLVVGFFLLVFIFIVAFNEFFHLRL